MYERRSGRFSRRSESKIYYPSARAQSRRGSRFRRRGSDYGASTDEKPSLLKRFSPHAKSARGKQGRRIAGKLFRSHKSSRLSDATKPAVSTAPRSAQDSPAPAGYTLPPAFPYHPEAMWYAPVPPAYLPPPPPPCGAPLFDEYGRRLSDEEIDEIYAREDYEDRYGRDFDHYTDHSPAASGQKEIFPKNYLVDDDK